MPLNRREFLALSAGLLVPILGNSASSGCSTRFISAGADKYNRYFVSGFDDNGTPCFRLPLPGRGHAAAIHPKGSEAVLVARRPGRFLVVIDLAKGTLRREIAAASDRHFNGHGVYSSDGNLLYVTENDYVAGRGVIGVYDATQNYRRVAELPSHGIGPHELLISSGGKTLIIANGGILTHPDSGRRKLNLDNMSPSLAYVDATSGALIAQHRLPDELHQLSIRHIAASNDTLCIAMQYQGQRTDQPPLVATHRMGENIRLHQAPDEIQKRMRNYCGSVCTDTSGELFAVSSPRGKLVTFWSTQGRFIGNTELIDGCGLAPGDLPGEFLLTSGNGTRVVHDAIENRRVPMKEMQELLRWDNHASRI